MAQIGRLPAFQSLICNIVFICFYYEKNYIHVHEKVYFPHLYNDILVLRAQEDGNENQLFLIQHSLY